MNNNCINIDGEEVYKALRHKPNTELEGRNQLACWRGGFVVTTELDTDVWKNADVVQVIFTTLNNH